MFWDFAKTGVDTLCRAYHFNSACPQHLHLSPRHLFPSFNDTLPRDHHARYYITFLSFIHPASTAISPPSNKKEDLTSVEIAETRKKDNLGNKIIVLGKFEIRAN